MNQSFITGAGSHTAPPGWRSTPRTSTGSDAPADRHDRARQPGRHGHRPELHPRPAASAPAAGWRSTPRTSTGPDSTATRWHDRARQPRRHGRRPQLHHRRGRRRAGGVAVDAAHVYWANTLARTIGRANLDGTGVDQSFITGAGRRHRGGGRRRARLLGQPAALGGGRSGAPTSTARASTRASSPRARAVPCGVAVDAAHVYWAAAMRIDRARQPGRHGSRTGASSPSDRAPPRGGGRRAGTAPLERVQLRQGEEEQEEGHREADGEGPRPRRVGARRERRSVKGSEKGADAAGKQKLPVKPGARRRSGSPRRARRRSRPRSPTPPTAASRTRQTKRGEAGQAALGGGQ